DFWSRHRSEAGYDLAWVEAADGTRGTYQQLLQVTDSSNTWRHWGPLDLSGFGGGPLDLRFSFVADVSVSLLGWVVEGLQVTGCGAIDPDSNGAHAVAYTHGPTSYCAGSSTMFDAVGSYCANGSAPAFQWRENGGALPGATAQTLAVPTRPPGLYDYVVDVS